MLLLLCLMHAQVRQRYDKDKLWWCHDIGYPLVATEHSPCKAPWSGTPCRATTHSRTMSPLDSARKPGFSLATSVLSALVTSWQMQYMNSHLPYHLCTLLCKLIDGYAVLWLPRNTFCGTWYLPHSQVNSDRTVPIMTVILHIFHCACAKFPYFYFWSKIWHHHPQWHENFSIRIYLRQI